MPSTRLASALRALGHRNFKLFFGGQLISLIGTWMQLVAESWLVYRLTGSAELLGWIGFASQIPVCIFAPLGGALADRFSRHRILMATQIGAMTLAFVLAGLTLTHRIEVWHIFVLAALLGAINGFDIPTRQAFVAEMVGREHQMNAIALNSAAFNGARIIGPGVAGMMVASIGEGWCFFINAISYLAVLAGLILMKVAPRKTSPTTENNLDRIFGGFRFVARHPPIRTLLTLLALVCFMGFPYSVLMPIFADRVLHTGARGLGYLMSAAGVGALIASLALAGKPTVRGLGKWVAWSGTSFGFVLIFFSLSRSLWLSLLLLIPVGFSMMLQMASSNTLIQAMVPDELRGRVMAVYSMIFMGMAPLGSLVAGYAAERVGAPLTVASGAFVCILGAMIFATRLPHLRRSAQLLVTEQVTGGVPAEG